ncbi:Zinc Finger Cchc Domain-Containing Protein 2 [Manis pentadactyla]|nr:Zinc Finger Cchc Domain-Containing Protein 2 [Manis pentadactyla]
MQLLVEGDRGSWHLPKRVANQSLAASPIGVGSWRQTCSLDRHFVTCLAPLKRPATFLPTSESPHVADPKQNDS